MSLFDLIEHKEGDMCGINENENKIFVFVLDKLFIFVFQSEAVKLKGLELISQQTQSWVETSPSPFFLFSLAGSLFINCVTKLLIMSIFCYVKHCTTHPQH